MINVRNTEERRRRKRKRREHHDRPASIYAQSVSPFLSDSALALVGYIIVLTYYRARMRKKYEIEDLGKENLKCSKQFSSVIEKTCC